MVLRDAFSILVHMTQIVLGRGIFLIGSTGIPLDGSLVVSGDPSSFAVHMTQIVLGRGTSLFCKRFSLLQHSYKVSSLRGIHPLLEIHTKRARGTDHNGQQ